MYKNGKKACLLLLLVVVTAMVIWFLFNKPLAARNARLEDTLRKNNNMLWLIQNKLRQDLPHQDYKDYEEILGGAGSTEPPVAEPEPVFVQVRTSFLWQEQKSFENWNKDTPLGAVQEAIISNRSTDFIVLLEEKEGAAVLTIDATTAVDATMATVKMRGRVSRGGRLLAVKEAAYTVEEEEKSLLEEEEKSILEQEPLLQIAMREAASDLAGSIPDLPAEPAADEETAAGSAAPKKSGWWKSAVSHLVAGALGAVVVAMLYQRRRRVAAANP